jgi:hypothetical protein
LLWHLKIWSEYATAHILELKDLTEYCAIAIAIVIQQFSREVQQGTKATLRTYLYPCLLWPYT